MTDIWHWAGLLSLFLSVGIILGLTDILHDSFWRVACGGWVIGIVTGLYIGLNREDFRL